jgi:HK97 family phage prohead protease
VFSCYFAVFGNEDRQGDIIEQGAFTNLDTFPTDGWIALSHDQRALAVAMPMRAIQDSTGLLVTGKFHSTAAAQECRTVIKERIAAGRAVFGSIGYRIVKDRYDSRGGKTVHVIEQLEVYECSFVALPANPAARLVSV